MYQLKQNVLLFFRFLTHGRPYYILFKDMGSFNEALFEQKLLYLKDTHDSIANLSSWCLSHQEHHGKIVSTWLNVLKRGIVLSYDGIYFIVLCYLYIAFILW